MPTQWNDDEDVALDYLPHVDQVIYLRGIRRRMNYQTGVAGGPKSGISYSWLSQLTEVHIDIGSNAKPKPRLTLSALRASLARLERAGLIERVPNRERCLIFRCLLATRGQSASVRNDRGTTEERQTRNDNDFMNGINAFSGMNDRGELSCCTARNDTIQGSGIQVLRVSNDTVEPALGGPDLGLRQEDQKPRNGALSADGVTLPVRTVFGYWQQVMNHPQAILDKKRQRAIAARLKEGHTVDQLKQAIDGCKASAWHQGQNDRHQVYDDIELICRDAKRVEAFMARMVGQTAQQQELDAWLNEGRCLEGECCRVPGG